MYAYTYLPYILRTYPGGIHSIHVGIYADMVDIIHTWYAQTRVRPRTVTVIALVPDEIARRWLPGLAFHMYHLLHA